MVVFLCSQGWCCHSQAGHKAAKRASERPKDLVLVPLTFIREKKHLSQNSQNPIAGKREWSCRDWLSPILIHVTG